MATSSNKKAPSAATMSRRSATQPAGRNAEDEVVLASGSGSATQAQQSTGRASTSTLTSPLPSSVSPGADSRQSSQRPRPTNSSSTGNIHRRRRRRSRHPDSASVAPTPALANDGQSVCQPLVERTASSMERTAERQRHQGRERRPLGELSLAQADAQAKSIRLRRDEAAESADGEANSGAQAAGSSSLPPQAAQSSGGPSRRTLSYRRMNTRSHRYDDAAVAQTRSGTSMSRLAGPSSNSNPTQAPARAFEDSEPSMTAVSGLQDSSISFDTSVGNDTSISAGDIPTTPRDGEALLLSGRRVLTPSSSRPAPVAVESSAASEPQNKRQRVGDATRENTQLDPRASVITIRTPPRTPSRRRRAQAANSHSPPSPSLASGAKSTTMEGDENDDSPGRERRRREREERLRAAVEVDKDRGNEGEDSVGKGLLSTISTSRDDEPALLKGDYHALQAGEEAVARQLSALR